MKVIKIHANKPFENEKKEDWIGYHRKGDLQEYIKK